MQLRHKVGDLKKTNLRVEKLDLLHPYDVQNASRWELDSVINGGAAAESGPMSEIPLDLMHRIFATNFFGPLDLTQRFARKLVDERRTGKIVFTSSIGGLIAVPFGGPWYTCNTRGLGGATAGAMLTELAPFGIQVQVINPGGFLTGFNETEAESATHWMDDRANYFKSADVQAYFDRLLGIDENRLDPQLMADFMVGTNNRRTQVYPETSTSTPPKNKPRRFSTACGKHGSTGRIARRPRRAPGRTRSWVMQRLLRYRPRPERLSGALLAKARCRPRSVGTPALRVSRYFCSPAD